MAERFGDFELLSLLSADAALESYLAAPPGGGAPVLLRRMKRALVSQPGARDTFLQDAQAAMLLSHAGAARVVAVGEVAHQPYVAQERVDGDSLETVFRRAKAAGAWPLPLPRALALFLPALEGLAAAHGQRPPLLHREVSPRNVYLTAEGRSVLTSFGLARTRRSAGLGICDAFVSPEQMHGRPLDAASDAFTAALLLFELACGRLPASGEVGEIVARIGTGELDAAAAVRPEAAPLGALLRRALAPHREERFADAKALLAAVQGLGLETEPLPDLAQWLQDLPPAPPPAPVMVPEVAECPPLPAPAAQAPARAEAPAAVAAVEKRPRLSKKGRFFVGLLLGLGATLLTLVVANPGGQHVDSRATPGDPPSVFNTSLTSLPPGVMVHIDGQRAGKTPLEFRAERDRVYRVEFDSSAGAIEVMVQNTRLLEVDLEQHAVVRDERYAGSRPRKKGTRTAPAPPPPSAEQPPSAQQSPAQSAQFRATAPARFTLDRVHHLRVDDGPQLPLEGGTLTELQAGFHSGAPPPVDQRKLALRALDNTGSMRPHEVVRALPEPAVSGDVSLASMPHLSLLLSRTATGVRLVALETGTAEVPALPSWAFVLTERISGAVETSPVLALTHPRTPRPNAAIVAVEGDNRFSVDGLGAQAAWRLTLRAKDAARAAAAVVRLQPAGEQAASLDGVPLGRVTAVLAPSSSHLVSGAAGLWLTVPTVSGFEPSPIEVSVEPAQAPAAAPAPRK